MMNPLLRHQMRAEILQDKAKHHLSQRGNLAHAPVVQNLKRKGLLHLKSLTSLKIQKNLTLMKIMEMMTMRMTSLLKTQIRNHMDH